MAPSKTPSRECDDAEERNRQVDAMLERARVSRLKMGARLDESDRIESESPTLVQVPANAGN